MIQWKQRLYAFLLRRILGPFLDSSSYQQLHDSIDVSIQEGTFVLKNVGLNSEYLTQRIALKSPGLVIRNARIGHLEICLTLRENDEQEEDGDDTEVPQSSFAWRAMRFGTSSAAVPAVSLVALIKIDGISLELETSAADHHNVQRIVESPDDAAATDCEPSSRSLIGSYIDAALASLQLSLNLTKINITVQNKTAANEAWLSLRLSSISYQDKDVSRNKDATSGGKIIFQKVIKCSEIELQSGDQPAGDGSVKVLSSRSTVALARGSGQVNFRVFEYSDGSSAQPNVQQDIEAKLNHQLHLSLDKKSLFQIKSVLDGLTKASQIDDQNDTTEISRTSLAGSPLDMDYATDQEDLKALTGIMKQYREAYHAAEKQQLRGGVLIPSSAFLDGIPLPEEDDGGTFDLFFDANDQSFYNATSVLAESMRIQEKNDGTEGFIHTKLRFHLLSIGMKIVFREPEVTHSLLPHEYILMTLDDLNLSHASSNSSSESSLSIGHLEIEDAQFSDTNQKSSEVVSIGGAPVVARNLDIGTLIGFSLVSPFYFRQLNDDGRPLIALLSILSLKDADSGKDDNLVFDAPCFSLSIQKNRQSASTDSVKCDATLLPLELCVRQRTLSNISSLSAYLKELQSDSQSSSTQSVGSDTNRSQHFSFQCNCPSITVLLPLVHEVSTHPVFERTGEVLNNVLIKGPSLGVLLENTAFEWIAGSADEYKNNLEDGGRFLCNNILFFVQSPVGDAIALNANMQRADLLMASGRLEVNPCIPISIEIKPNTGDGKVGRDSFPLAPTISSFKARQEDEDEDIKIDRLLFSKLNDVNADSRKELRGSDPQLVMVADARKAEFVVVLSIPEITADFTSSEMETILNILSAVKKPESAENHSFGKHPRHKESGPSRIVGFALNISRITLALHEDPPVASQLHEQESYSVVLAIDNCKAHVLLHDSSTKHLRLMIHEPCVYEDISRDKQNEKRGFSENRVHLTVYHLTYRYDIDSKWIERIAGMVPKSRGSEAQQNSSELEHQPHDGRQSMTKVYFSLADFNLDYTPPTYFDTMSRNILRIGDFRFSSNIMKPITKTQAYSISLGDLAFHVCNHKLSYRREDLLLCRSSLMWNTNQKPEPVASASTSMSTSETLLRELGFVSVLSLDMMDAIVVVREKARESTPKLMTSLTFGTLSMNACKDAFSCFATTMGELNAKLTALTDDDIKELSKEDTGDARIPALSSPVGKEMTIHENEFLGDVPKPKNGVGETNLLDGYEWTAIDHDPLPEPKIPDGDEQVAGWYNGEKKSDSDGPFGKVLPQIIQQHFPVRAVSDPLSDGDMGASTFVGKGATVVLKSRLMIHQLTVKIRLYDGYDWPENMSQEQIAAATRRGASFVIDTLPEIERKQLKDKLNQNAGAESRKAKLLGDLLAQPEVVSDTFSSMPLPEEKATSIELKERVRRFSRKSHLFCQVSANGVTLRIDSYEKDKSHRLVSVLALSVSDLFIAETASGPSPIKMLGEWVNDNEHPHDSRFGTLMVKMVTWHPANRITADNEVESDECEVSVQLLPMRCILDQRAINFIQSFFYNEEAEKANSAKWSADLHYLPPPRFRAFRVKPWKLKVDYSPQARLMLAFLKLDVSALREGSFVELINVSPIDSMVITLSQASIENVVGFGLVGSGLVRSWVQEICATQLHKFLANARPFEPFSDVGLGVTDLIVLPYEAFKNGEDIRRAMGSGIKSLAETFAFQTLTTTSRLTQYAANKMAGTVRGRRRVNVASNPLPSRPSAPPRGVGDVTGHAMESLARGIQAANYKVVIVPYREYARNGATGAVTSVIKGVPVLLVAPLTGATEALSYTLLGARNALRPDIRKEEEATRNGITGYDI
eukprot:scaffold4060_cov121-Cylindrotheca_fusiformis.AAC.2